MYACEDSACHLIILLVSHEVLMTQFAMYSVCGQKFYSFCFCMHCFKYILCVFTYSEKTVFENALHAVNTIFKTIVEKKSQVYE